MSEVGLEVLLAKKLLVLRTECMLWQLRASSISSSEDLNARITRS